jgi:alkanesulfonate monooxygenase SsuD/methylene tetrahydromethanopterin reductase-like flavin-dependent oxidoreductase (luciferase family)
MYQGVSEDEVRQWMLLGTADSVCRQIDAFIAAGVTHFVLTLSPYNFDVFERFAAEVMPRYR